MKGIWGLKWYDEMLADFFVEFSLGSCLSCLWNRWGLWLNYRNTCFHLSGLQLDFLKLVTSSILWLWSPFQTLVFLVIQLSSCVSFAIFQWLANFSRAGKDKSVVLWCIHDHISTLATEPGSTKSPAAGGNTKAISKAGQANGGNSDSPSVGPRGIYKGHQDTVEDVQFCPSR